MSKTTHYKRTILTAASGATVDGADACGSVNLPLPVSSVTGAKIVDGVGILTLEAVGGGACRLFVTGGVIGGSVTLEFDVTV